MIRLPRLLAIASILASATMVGCADDSPGTVRFAGAADDVQRAVDRLSPGDMLVLEPGIYTEPIVVSTEGVTVRGRDRNSVIFDGMAGSGTAITVTADEVSIENLTARNWQINGVLVSGVTSSSDTSPISGFRVSHVTAYNNGLYGIYAFQAGDGTIVDSYVSGHPDSGVYVGQCQPCNVTVERVTAERNAVGYEGTNASSVYVIDSVFRHNRIGITPNSQHLERLAPQGRSVFAGNVVSDNGNPDAPEQASGGFGIGIAVGGGVSNVVTRNRVERNVAVGVLVTTLDGFLPTGNRIAGNVLDDNGIDLGFWTFGGTTDVDGNVFESNSFETSSPGGIEGMGSSVTADVPIMPTSPAGPSPRDVTAPGPQMPMDPRSVEVLPEPWSAWSAPEWETIAVPEAAS